MSCKPLHSKTRLARHAMAAGIALAVVAMHAGARAQAAPPAAASAAHRIDLPAAPLTQSLNALAQQTGVQILYAGHLTSNRSAPALQGSFSVQQALQRLLAGSGLKATAQDDKTWSIQREGDGAGAAQALPEVNVSADRESATEGTHSYTTGVTSTATKMNLSIRETPQTISVITRQRIEDQGITSMTDVLNQVPGITMSQDGGRYNIYSRGSAINTYQIDGVTMTQENQTRNMPHTFLDMALYDHVEVVRGATGLMTGAGDPSGVVNLVRKKPTAQFQASAQATVGSWDFYRAEADLSGPLIESGRVRGRVVAARQNSNSFVDWYKLEKDIFYGAVETDLSGTTLLRLSMDYQKYKPTGGTGVPLIYSNGAPTSFDRSTSPAAKWHSDAMETYNYTATLEQKLPQDWTLKTVANYMDSDRKVVWGQYQSTSGRSYINQATGLATISQNRALAHQIQRGVDLTLQGPFTLLGRKHELIAGFSYNDYESKHNGYDSGTTTVNFNTWNHELALPPSIGLVQVFNVASRQRGYFAATRLNLLDRLNLIAGARLSDYDYDYLLTQTGYRLAYQMRERSKLTPYAGLTYDLTPQQSLYLSYTDIFKPQSAFDRYGKVLDPVVGRNYELGWKGDFYNGRLNANVAVYRIDRDNMAADDIGFTVPGTTDTASVAVKGARTEGIDLELSGEIARGWNLQTSFSHATTKDAKGQRTLTYMPANTFRLWTTYNLPGEWSQWTVGGGASWNSDTSLLFSTYNSTVRQDAYTVVSLMARYRFSKQLVATLNINNLFDKTYYAGMAGSYGHYGDPRNAMLTLRYDF